MKPHLLLFYRPFETKEARVALGPEALARFIPGAYSAGVTVPDHWIVTRQGTSHHGAGIGATFREALSRAKGGR